MLAFKELFAEYESGLLTNMDRETDSGLPANHIKMWFPKSNNRIGIILGLFQCFFVWIYFRPRIIITTGAGLSVPIFIWGKLFGSKLIFVESRARIYSKSLSGKFLAPLCDKVIVQWPEMLNIYKNAEYWGTIV
jgi:UDP-N-acetylglucosamine:LPS N-acetylglucosamine transferase